MPLDSAYLARLELLFYTADQVEARMARNGDLRDEILPNRKYREIMQKQLDLTDAEYMGFTREYSAYKRYVFLRTREPAKHPPPEPVKHHYPNSTRNKT